MKEVKIYTIVSDQLSPPITGESFCTDMVRHSDYAELEAKCAAMVAENAELKSALNDILQPDAAVLERNHRVRALDAMETPATDEFLAEVRASARNEGINYSASRLAAAFNHGFLDKPVSEVLDVTRMILSAKEDLSNDPLPADDGLSGEYAEKAIEEWAAQLRKGVQS
ncbi:hypothetical protein N4V73_001607 [Salmonella enterica subsp. enterica serovar Meleagridis]|uniref:Eae protein n=2 Tax=Salmonella enterica TaxID=28901 RepID=A0A5Z5S240_SALET|nr:hypothetical protein [Salmonella enterica]ECT5319472.1 hypothetical protein [Salmonella enterica subsp. enterica]ECT6658407.1 hypothetical protein [Salmonella enterica subsp. enterica serovar 3,10:e,h:-]EDD1446437.1 hypothetical protein [Salmonella enterica subsp. enterica serovar Amsterdam]EDJ9761036.1 hypothetical protein [Salmonella enterica subsp. enterica serovar Give]EDN5473814.1 hypothetical protein [Salmonella enterica subsp. enterica serovar Muenchen]EDO2470900.1 hypothetical prot